MHSGDAKSFVCLNQSELRKALGVNRLSKQLLAGVPSIRIPGDSGEEEVWLFKNEAQPHRLCTIKTISSLEWQRQHLDEEKQTWQKQAEHVWRHQKSCQYDSTGVSAVMAKDTLVSLDEYVAKRVKKEQETPADGEAKYGEDEDDQVQLVGAAAHAQAVAVLSTSQSSQPAPTAAPDASSSLPKAALHTPKPSRASAFTSRTPSSQNLEEDLILVGESPEESRSVAASLFSDGGDGSSCYGLSS